MTATWLTSRPSGTRGDRAADPARGSRLVEHRPFLVTLALGALLRVVVLLAYAPAIIHSDGPAYLLRVEPLLPLADRPVGYTILLLKPLSWLTADVTVVTVVQHVIGMLTAVVLYGLLRRWDVGRWPATLAALPVLLDPMQLNLEHSIHSDSLFVLLVTSALAVLLWRRRGPLPVYPAYAAGLLLGTATTVRQLGGVLLLAGLLAVVLLGRSAGRRAVLTVLLLIGFAGPVLAYATWFHEDRDRYALSDGGGQALYARVTTFVDCARLEVPDYQRVLCPPEALGHRFDPSYYSFDDPRTVARLELPPGVTAETAMGEFARAAIRAQPLDYAAYAARDFLLNFDVTRGDRFEYRTAYKWRFGHYEAYGPPDKALSTYDEHGGRLRVHEPWARVLTVYERVVYLPGPVLLVCVVAGLATASGLFRARRSGLRTATAVLLLAAVSLLAVPDLTAQFVWRYQLPALALLPAVGALSWTALRRPQPPEAGPEAEADPGAGPEADAAGTRATASTD